ncbi:ECF transporter S component [Clostridium sp. LP20]|uniref:ECF transporter S component n=1 Tax=Clostridium sp. LP20 TaxID=3418665 RepID=UPI003EE5F4F8
METTSTKQKFGTRQLVLIGMLSGISIFMGLTGIGFIPLPWMKASIMHVPVIIGAVLEGPIVGAAVGLVFGLFSIYQNITTPALLSPIFMNPIIAIVPRVLIGIVSYYVFKFVKNTFHKEKLGLTLAAIAGTATNTIGVLGLTYILALDKFAALKDISNSAVAYALTAIGTTNGIPEVLVSVLIVVPVVTGLFKIYKRKK